VDSSEQQGNIDGTSASISADGRFVAFQDATAWSPADTNGNWDVFVRDRLLGTTEYVSLTPSGNPTNNGAGMPSISGDGRYVAFESYSDDLVAGDTNNRTDIFVRDRSLGVTTRVSVDNAGGEANSDSFDAQISGDGRYVSFASGATNLVAGDTNGALDAFVHDMTTMATERISLNSSGQQADAGLLSTERPLTSINSDGRFVAFVSGSSNLDPRATSGNVAHIYVRDRLTSTTELIDVNGSGTIGETSSVTPDISGDGRYLAFAGSSANLAPGDSGYDYDVFVRDRQSGTTVAASVDSAGNYGNGYSQHPAISGDGQIVSFFSAATNLVSGDTNGANDVFAHDLTTGSTVRVSLTNLGAEPDSQSTYPDANANGRYIAFESDASNLVSGDTNGVRDVFVRDRQGVNVGAPASLTLTPPDAVNMVGTSHTVTATVHDAGTNPVAGVLVRFAVSGSSSTSGSCTTDAAGQCGFTYSGPTLAGADIISAYADSDGNASQGPGEPGAEATKAWILPASTAGQASGGGQIWNSSNTDKIAFGFNAQSTGSGLHGNCEVVDPTPANNVKIKCLDVTTLVQSGTHATLFGNAVVNGTTTTYRIDVDDLGEPGSGFDKFRIVTANGYSVGGMIANGNIQIRN
jgi:hypothetical protein